MDLDEHFARSFARARRGRAKARAIFLYGLGLPALATFFIVAAPQSMGGGPDPRMGWLLGVAAVGVTIGLIWMWRILRADPEADARPWRYREP
jgi:hypothetical protein